MNASCTCECQHIPGWVVRVLLSSVQKSSAPQTLEKLGYGAGAGCGSSGVCSLYRESFLRVSRKSREMCCSFRGCYCWAHHSPRCCRRGYRVNPDPRLVLAQLCRLLSLAWGSWLPLPEVGGYFALARVGRHQHEGEKGAPMVLVVLCYVATCPEGEAISVPG